MLSLHDTVFDHTQKFSACVGGDYSFFNFCISGFSKTHVTGTNKHFVGQTGFNGIRKIKQILETKCCEFTQNSVKVVAPNGVERNIEADSLVFSMGMRSNSTDGVKADCPVYTVGDCKQDGNVGDAVRGGYMGAMEII